MEPKQEAFTPEPLYKALWQSLYMRETYYQAAHYWGGKAFLYLLMLVAIVSMAIAYIAKVNFDEFMEEDGRYIIEQMPAIEISDGQLIVDREMPYPIYDLEQNVVLVIDTTNAYQSPEQANAIALLNNQELMVRKHGGRMETVNLSEFGNIHVDKEVMRGFAQTAQAWMIPVLGPLLALVMFVYRVVQALVYASIATLIAAFMKSDLKFHQLMQMSIVAMTPAMVFDVIALYFRTPVPGWVSLVMTVGYIVFAIKGATGGLHDDRHGGYTT